MEPMKSGSGSTAHGPGTGNSEPGCPPRSRGAELALRSFNSGFCGINGTLGFDFFTETLMKPRGHIENVYRKAVLHLCHPDRVGVTAPGLQTSVALAVFYCRCCLPFKAS